MVCECNGAGGLGDVVKLCECNGAGRLDDVELVRDVTGSRLSDRLL